MHQAPPAARVAIERSLRGVAERDDASAPAPRVAIVIPCFNDGATVGEAIESGRKQEPCEIVVVDDGSTDPGTLAELDRLAAGGTLVVRQQNQGPAAARMAGVRATSAGYILPLDADDMLVPGAVTYLADALDRAPEAAVAWGDGRVFGDRAFDVRTAPSLDPWLITYANGLPAQSLVRREVVLAVGGWGPGYSEDWELWLAIAERGWSGVHVPYVAHLHRKHGPRRAISERPHHAETRQEFLRRHPALFAARRENRRRSSAAMHVKLLLPLIEHLPLLSAWRRHTLYSLVVNPTAIVERRLARVGRGFLARRTT